MGTTLEMLRIQWGRAMLDGDFDTVDRIDAARERIEALHVRSVRSCVWAGTETCRLCVKSDTCSMSAGAA